MLEMALVENVQRVDLNPIDRAKAFERLMSEFNLSTTEISDRIGKSPSFVSNTLRMLKLPDALKDGLLSGVITEGHARALAAIDDNRTMIEAYKMILKESGSVRRAEELARRMKKRDGQQRKSGSPRKALILNEELDKIQSDINTYLGNGNAVKLKQSRVETKLQLTLKGSPDRVKPTLEKIHRALS
jgi:ParB family chromosome partitioning protein